MLSVTYMIVCLSITHLYKMDLEYKKADFVKLSTIVFMSLYFMIILDFHLLMNVELRESSEGRKYYFLQLWRAEEPELGVEHPESWLTLLFLA